MLSVLLPYPGFVAIGLLWQGIKFFDIPAVSLRRTLNALLFSFLLPAYALPYLWQAKLNMALLYSMGLMTVALVLSFAMAWLWLRRKRWGAATRGGLLMAAAFPAMFALGLPLMGHTTGLWAQRLAVEAGALVMLPLMFSLGSYYARELGKGGKQPQPPAIMLHHMPMFWAVVAGLALNLLQIQPPQEVTLWLQHLSAGLLPLMLMLVGISLRWRKGWFKVLFKFLPLILISLLLTPALVWLGAELLQLHMPKTLTSLMLLAALPATTLGFSLCERYQLDTVAYNIAYTALFAGALLTVPALWLLVQAGLIPV